MLLEFDPKKQEVISHAPPNFGFLIHITIDLRDGTVYFCQPGNNQIVSYRRGKGYREYSIPTKSAGPGRLDFDSKGNLWFPELYADKLAKLDPQTGTIQEWELPVKKGTPAFCRVDSDDSVWVSLPMADRILHFKNGLFREYIIPTKASLVSTSTTDEAGYVWFTEGGWRGSAGGNKVGRLDPRTGMVEEFTLPTPNAQPLGLIKDKNGVFWTQQMNAGKICRLRELAKDSVEGSR
jgi:virginiamycin B lyase